MPHKKNKPHAPTLRPFCSAVVPAAGLSRRMDGRDKLTAELAGAPVLAHTLTALQRSESIDELVIVARGDEIAGIYDICVAYGIDKTAKVIRGGDTRQASVLAGVLEVSQDARLVAVHDGARPLVRVEDIDACVAAAAKTGAAVLAVPVKDTIKEADGRMVRQTTDRQKLWAVQTPQVFDKDILKGALTQAAAQRLELTDDSAAVELLGIPVHIVEGHDDNIKITTPVDLIVAAGLLEGQNADWTRL